MSSIYVPSSPVMIMAGLNKTNTRAEAGIHCTLPGASDFGRIYKADPRNVEEMCAFYDDFTHDYRIEWNLFELALADLCAVHPTLW